MTTSEEARTAWADAVAEANERGDAHQAAVESRADEFTIERRKHLHEQAQSAVDAAYKVYLTTLSDWVSEAPRRFDVVLVAAVARIEDRLIPAITFGFRGGTDAPVTVTLVNTELDLRRFQKQLDKAITDALRETREQS